MALAIRTKRAGKDVNLITGDMTVPRYVVIAAHKEKADRHPSVMLMGYVYLAATKRSWVHIV